MNLLSPGRETVFFALSRGAIDKGARYLREATERGKLIILSAPILVIKGILPQISPLLKEGGDSNVLAVALCG